MSGEEIGNILGWSILGLMVCIGLIMLLALVWMTR